MALTLSIEEIIEQSKSPLLAIAPDWKRVRLGDIAAIQNGAPFKSELFNKDGKGMPVIRIRDVGSEGTDTYYSGEYDEAYIVREGDLLIGMDGDFNCARWKGPDALLNQRVCRIIPKTDKYEPRLMDFALPGYLKAINDVTSSVTVKHLSSKTVADILLPLPPLPGQRRIVSAIETQLGRLVAAVARLQGAKARLKRYKQAVLTSATTGNQRSEDGSAITPVVIGKPSSPAPKGWQWSLLLNLAKLESGHTPRKTIKEYWEGGDVPWICLQDIRDADGTVIMDTKFHPTMMGINNSSARLLPEGTVVFSRDISVGFVTIMGKVMATTQHFANWICGEKLNNRFLMYSLMASRGPLLHQGQGTTVKTIYMDELQQFHVLHPGIEMQQRIAEEIRTRLDGMAEMETTLNAQLVQAGRLRQAVLKRAFEGRLV